MSYQQIVYDEFRKAGATESGALAVVGNFIAESGCEPNRLENDYDPHRTVSKDYVLRASSGNMSKAEFCKAVGFGLAQWTFPSRKANLWEFWKSSNKELDDIYMQIEFAIKEFKQDFPEVWKLLCLSNDLYTCVKRVCYDFENPYIKNVDARFRYANEEKNIINLNNFNNKENAKETINNVVSKNHDLNLRNIDKNCNGFIEVEILKTLLLIRNYKIDKDMKKLDTWSTETSTAVLQFQKDYNLISDCIVGQKTWEKLLKIKE